MKTNTCSRLLNAFIVSFLKQRNKIYCANSVQIDSLLISRVDIFWNV